MTGPRITTSGPHETLADVLAEISAKLSNVVDVNEGGVFRLREMVRHLETMTGAEDILDSEGD